MSDLDELIFNLIEEAVDSLSDEELLACATDQDLRDVGEIRSRIKQAVKQCSIST